MEDLILILPQKNKSAFAPKIEMEGGENFLKLYLKDKGSALKKAAKIIDKRMAVVSNDALDMKSIKGFLKKYNDLNSELLFSLTENAIEEVAKERAMHLPLYEVCIFAEPFIAVKIIEKIKSLSKIFTIITKEEFGSEILDELYFKYGVIIRHLTKLTTNNKKDTVIISTDSEDNIMPWESTPVISLADKCKSENALMLKNLYIKGEQNAFIKEWNGKPPAVLYSLLNMEKDNKISVNIKEKADEIFVLDIM